MNADTHSFEIDGVSVRTGTAIYDTKFDRVLWIAEIGDYEIMIDVVKDYTDDEPLWWSTDDDPARVADGSRIGIDTFRSLVEADRFEIGSQPSTPGVSP